MDCKVYIVYRSGLLAHLFAHPVYLLKQEKKKTTQERLAQRKANGVERLACIHSFGQAGASSIHSWPHHFWTIQIFDRAGKKRKKQNGSHYLPISGGPLETWLRPTDPMASKCLAQINGRQKETVLSLICFYIFYLFSSVLYAFVKCFD